MSLLSRRTETDIFTFLFYKLNFELSVSNYGIRWANIFYARIRRKEEIEQEKKKTWDEKREKNMRRQEEKN